MRRDAWVFVWLWLTGYVLWPLRFAKRWYLRLKLRRKMRSLGMIPVLVVMVPKPGTAQVTASSDSLIGTVLSRAAIPAWNGGDPIAIYCLTWVAEREDRPHVLVIIDAAPADTSQRPLCPDPRGGFQPLWIDGPSCPAGAVSPYNNRDFVIVRCGPDALARYRRYPPPTKRAGG